RPPARRPRTPTSRPAMTLLGSPWTRPTRSPPTRPRMRPRRRMRRRPRRKPLLRAKQLIRAKPLIRARPPRRSRPRLSRRTDPSAHHAVQREAEPLLVGAFLAVELEAVVVVETHRPVIARGHPQVTRRIPDRQLEEVGPGPLALF